MDFFLHMFYFIDNLSYQKGLLYNTKMSVLKKFNR